MLYIYIYTYINFNNKKKSFPNYKKQGLEK